MTDESKAIVVIRSKEGSIKSSVYFGVESELDFVGSSNEYRLDGVENYIESLKKFYKSMQVKKGEICAVVIIVDNKAVFDKVLKDRFFEGCYVLLAE